MNKIRTPTSVALLLSILLASAIFAAPASASEQVPLKGTLQAVETSVLQFPTLLVDSSGSGNATHLGRYTVSYEATANLLTGYGTGSAQFVAANGDILFAQGWGQATLTAPNVYMIHEEYTITGGTGRFAGASGSYVVERVLDMATGETSGTIDGRIAIH